jgi:uncharacterized membrane protein YphA (DoxX/SURF4 family)
MSSTLRNRENQRKETANRPRTSKVNVALWTVQTLLALLFLFAGSMKFLMPIEAMTRQIPFPAAFLYFIGVCEIAGAFGLILPSLLRIRPQLTPLAAAGLVIIMGGATGVTVAIGPVAPAAMPFIVGVLAAFVFYGRSRVAPIRARERRASLRATAQTPLHQAA